MANVFNGGNLLKQIQKELFVDLEVFAEIRIQAIASVAGADGTTGAVEIGSGAAEITDGALEIIQRCNRSAF